MQNPKPREIQIATDISPIISPASNKSGSFISPRDNLLVNFNSNKQNNNLMHFDLEPLQETNDENCQNLERSNKEIENLSHHSGSMESEKHDGKQST